MSKCDNNKKGFSESAYLIPIDCLEINKYGYIVGIKPIPIPKIKVTINK